MSTIYLVILFIMFIFIIRPIDTLFVQIIAGLYPWDGLGATASMAQYLDMIIPHHKRGKG